MENNRNYIAKVEIKSLWGRFDVTWNLNSDVNILSGINGSGKSTILRIMYSLASSKVVVSDLIKAKKANVTFADKNINDYSIDESRFIYETSYSGQIIYSTDGDINAYHLEQIHPIDNIHFNFIATFDNELVGLESVQKLSDNQIKTELDWQIYQLQKHYLDYQLRISRKKDKIIEKEYNAKAAISKLKYPQNRFLEIIDALFENTGKKLNREENEITFICNTKQITPYQLSSGEKQMLVILLTVLVQDNQNSVIFLDEPEISLHFDWQKKLIQYIRELNPNIQIILATHSPAVIMEGWLDKVVELSDLSINTNEKLVSL